MVGAVVSVVRSGENVAVAEVDVVEDSAEDGEPQISGELVGAVVSGGADVEAAPAEPAEDPDDREHRDDADRQHGDDAGAGPAGLPLSGRGPPSGPRNSFSADMVPPSSRRGL